MALKTRVSVGDSLGSKDWPCLLWSAIFLPCVSTILDRKQLTQYDWESYTRFTQMVSAKRSCSPAAFFLVSCARSKIIVLWELLDGTEPSDYHTAKASDSVSTNHRLHLCHTQNLEQLVIAQCRSHAVLNLSC